MKKLILFLFISSTCFAQSAEAEKILNKVIDEYNLVEDYQVDMTIIMDVDFLKMPKSKAKLFFKQPDKLQVDSKGFAMLPKGGINFSPQNYLKGDYTALYVKEETINGKVTDVIRAIPNSDTTDILLTKFWIDKEKSKILKIESNTKTAGTVNIEMTYADDFEYPLPSEIVFSFSLSGKNIARRLNQHRRAQQDQSEKSENFEGRVIVKYTNYIVNKGIPDEVFEKKE